MNFKKTFLMHSGCCGGHQDDTCSHDSCCESDHSCNSEESCGHGCGHHVQKLTLMMEDETQLTCEIINYVKHEEQTYILLKHPENQSIMIYRFQQNDDRTINLENIESREEHDAVRNIYTTYLNQLNTAL